MKNMKVSVKLMVSFLVVTALAVIIGAVGIFGALQINAGSTEIYQKQTRPLTDIALAREDFQRLRVLARDAVLATGDNASISAVAADIAQAEQVFNRYMEAYRPNITAPDAVQIFNDTMSAFGQYQQSVQRLVTSARDGEDQDILAAQLNAMSDQADRISENLGALMDIRVSQATQVNANNNTMFTTVLILIAVVIIASIAISLFFAFYISALIGKPLAPLTSFFNRAAKTGDLEFEPAEMEAVGKFKHNKDELGQLSTAIAEFMGEIQHEMAMLEKVADGDLTIEPKALSPKDVVGNSLVKVVDNLNNMFSEINMASTQVSAGSQQIADGAQSLAQGSTEQAATVEELSASITEIAEKTRANAGMALQAAGLASTIKGNAEKGSRQMDEMVSAVNEISQASQSISRVIKVIDDIAFQTNILALNAAVEAARAGQHGKGFAVVADEVRTLAAKSAEAAKDTGVLISNSMEKAQHGARIAKETAESLVEIVSGINESSAIISEIANASEVQSSGIGQVNSGIDQVATVVQQNSATAEESAAAAEQLSGQSAMLENLISLFKLKNAGAGFGKGRAPAGMAGPKKQPAFGGGEPSSATGFSLGNDFSGDAGGKY